jgi:hypothetical protein
VADADAGKWRDGGEGVAEVEGGGGGTVADWRRQRQCRWSRGDGETSGMTNNEEPATTENRMRTFFHN